MSAAADRRRSLLTAALGFLQLPPQTSALRALHAWLDSWRGVGLIVEGMRRQGYRVSLREIDAWVASFRSHPMVSDDGFASAPTPWEAVQRAGVGGRQEDASGLLELPLHARMGRADRDFDR